VVCVNVSLNEAKIMLYYDKKDEEFDNIHSEQAFFSLRPPTHGRQALPEQSAETNSPISIHRGFCMSISSAMNSVLLFECKVQMVEGKVYSPVTNSF